MNRSLFHRILFTGIILYLPMTGFTQADQTLEEYRQQNQEELQQYRDSIFRNLQQYRDSVFRELEYYRDSLNIPFGMELRQPWRSYRIGLPQSPPRYQFSVPGFLCGNQLPSLPIPLKTEDFYGISLNFSFPARTRFQLKGISKEEVSKAWIFLNECNLVDPMSEALVAAEKINLNGWGHYRLTCYLADQIFDKNARNEKIVFQFFLMSQFGYRCKIGQTGKNKLELLLPFNRPIYDHYSILSDNLSYYLLDPSPQKKNLDAPPIDFGYRRRIPDLYQKFPLKLGKDLHYKSFPFPDSPDSVRLPINTFVIDFYRSYPSCDLYVYGMAGVMPELFRDARDQFRPLLASGSETEKVRLILQFVNTMVPYKPDSAYWGKERYFFPEECLWYPFMDCEDRAVLFRYLVSTLTGNEVLLIASGEHIYTAVRFKDPVSGDYIPCNGKKYIICDPSCDNPRPGKTMPRCKGKKYTIIGIP